MTVQHHVRVAIGTALYPVGDLIFETDGHRQHSVFRYAPEWRGRDGAFALAPSLPLNEYPSFHSGGRIDSRNSLPGPFSDTAPDSWGRGLITKDLGYAPNEMDFLLAANDSTRQGALRFLDEHGRPLAFSVPPTPRLTDLEGLQRLARAFDSGQGDLRQIARELRGTATSLGGARPKSDFDDGGVLSIVKFTTERDTMPIERMEVATLNLASSVGLRAASAHLALKKTKYPVAIIRRFDRIAGKRYHYISARTLTGKEHGAHGYYTDIADAMRQHGGRTEQLLCDLREIFDRILFTILVSNNDDHLQNHGFLWSSENGWRLAPAFDINPQPERLRSLATGISPLSGNIASIEAAIDAAPFFDIDEDNARNTAYRMAVQISEEWMERCRRAGMTAVDCSNYTPAFDNPEMRAALRLAPRPVGSEVGIENRNNKFGMEP